jgi:hypothetical protein
MSCIQKETQDDPWKKVILEKENVILCIVMTCIYLFVAYLMTASSSYNIVLNDMMNNE